MRYFWKRKVFISERCVNSIEGPFFIIYSESFLSDSDKQVKVRDKFTQRKPGQSGKGKASYKSTKNGDILSIALISIYGTKASENLTLNEPMGQNTSSKANPPATSASAAFNFSRYFL